MPDRPLMAQRPCELIAAPTSSARVPPECLRWLRGSPSELPPPVVTCLLGRRARWRSGTCRAAPAVPDPAPAATAPRCIHPPLVSGAPPLLVLLPSVCC